jgi:hypothetical protein
MNRQSTANILDGYVLEEDFARENKISPRTSAEYRKQPNGLPYALWGGRVYIHVQGGREYLAARTRHPNPRR